MGTVYNKFNYLGEMPLVPPAQYEFQMIVIHIPTIRNQSNDYISLTKVEFKTSGGTVYEFPTGTDVKTNLPAYIGEGAENLIDPSLNTKMTCTWNSSKGLYVTITLPRNHYLDISTYNKFSWYTEDDGYYSRDPISWDIWVYNMPQFSDIPVLVNHEFNYPTTSARVALAYTGDLTFANSIPIYKYIKLHVTTTRTVNCSYMQLSEIVFRGLYENFEFPSGTTITSNINPFTAAETVAKLIDGNVSTKYCTRSWGNPSSGCDIIITLPTGSELSFLHYPIFGWYTGDDASERDPVTWVLYGANQSNFSDAVILDQTTSYSVTTNRKALAYESSCIF